MKRFVLALIVLLVAAASGAAAQSRVGVSIGIVIGGPVVRPHRVYFARPPLVLRGSERIVVLRRPVLVYHRRRHRHHDHRW